MTRQTTEESDDVGEEIHGIYPREGLYLTVVTSFKGGGAWVDRMDGFVIAGPEQVRRLEYGLGVHEQKCFAILCPDLADERQGLLWHAGIINAKPKPIVAINCRPMSSQHLMRTWGGSTR